MVNLVVNFYIEAAGNDKKAVETSILEIERKLSNEKIEVIETKREDIIETEDPKARYSAVLEAKLRGELGEVVTLIMKYGPSIVELEDIEGKEIHARELVKVLALISKFMGGLMDKFGGLAIYPDLSAIPEPKVGYEEEEIEKMIIDEGLIRYQLVFETFGNSKEEIDKSMKRALALEGCRINKFASQLMEEQVNNNVKRVKVLVASELLSSLEVLFILTAKYAPVAIVILEPEIIDIKPNELQNALSELAAMVNELIHRPLIIKER
ncbi:hypothetical protein PNA2_1974 [Pyrococcus sp. NA2]|uniref:hypothetical protein n=1 Tax=Pyrococcus sp. (strain NA2) TaxID=342949 RepID=UPI000209AE3C|nr:hypothetical protein [Pyrococcus sp. NA2]AEC52888.1 hypothetical protein PNA2_1974 [Pyrococcus sp. NA2]